MPSGYTMQVVAHEDDDLFFLNPDIQAAINAGLPTVTVYVSAGQGSGDGATDGDRAASRQQGVRAAYAQMTGLNVSAWSGDLLWVAGRQVERYTLTGTVAPVEVIFIGLPDGGLEAVNAGQVRSTVLPTGGMAYRQYSYTRTDVVAVLTGLMARYQPTLVRYQDTLADSRYIAEHADHKAAAAMTRSAAEAYSDAVLCIPYRCYNISYVPKNLSPADRATKLATAQAYLAHDSTAAPSGWTDAVYQRWPRGTTWTARNADGRLQVFVVRAGQLWTWWQRTDGTWSGALAMGGAPLAPAVSVTKNADGRIQVFARRLDTHRIFTIWQTSPNGSWSAWTDLGSPNVGTPLADQLGSPLAVQASDGRIWLFLKNGGGGLAARCQVNPNDVFEATWRDLGGTDIQDGVAAAMNPGNCWEVTASTRAKILHWYQDTPNGPFVLNNSFPAPVPASPPTATLRPDGSVAVAYRTADTAEATVTSQVMPAGYWDPAVTVPGRPGVGALTVVAVPGTNNQPLLVARDSVGRAAVGWSTSTWTWTDLDGGPFIDAPTATVNPSGTVTLVGVGFNGLVHVCTQTAAGAGVAFGPWQALQA